MSLRVLYLLPAEGFGGAERQGIYHVSELPLHGVELTALVGPGRPILRELERAGVPHEPFEYFPALSDAPQSASESAHYFLHWVAAISTSVRKIEERIGSRRFDLIFANRTSAWIIAGFLSRNTRIPYVIRAGSRPAQPLFARALGLLERVSPPLAAFYNCQAVWRALSPYLHCPAFELPNAVDTRYFRPGAQRLARSRLGLPLDAPIVGLAARPAPEKGFELLARVIGRVSTKLPSVLFAIAGEFGWRAHYETRLREAGLGSRIRFLGHVENMPDFFRASDVIVLTSRERSIEGSPNALLEAMAVGRPVVATSVGGVSELIQDGRTGYLTGDRDDALFSERLLRLLEAPELARGIAGAARVQVMARHDVSRVVAVLADDFSIVESSRSAQNPYAGVAACASNTHFAPSSS